MYIELLSLTPLVDLAWIVSILGVRVTGIKPVALHYVQAVNVK